MNLKHIALAFVVAGLAAPVMAQDKPEKAPKAATEKAEKPAKAPAKGTGSKVVVNGVTIPQSRFDVMNKERAAAGQPDSPEIQAAIKDELINRELIAQAAIKRGLDKTPEVVAQIDMTRQAVLVRALFESEIKANPITDAELKAQYEEFKKQMGENEYKVRHILVEKDDDAKAIIIELGKGGDFAKIAKEKSKDPGSKDNGGDLDWGPSARFVKPFADATVALKKGQTVAVPVKTDFGYHVIRLDDVRPLKVPAYDELKDNFRQRAQQQQVAKMVAAMRQSAKIEER
jgi:peptidyl-prolyl cis-trans isomerase C